LRKWLPSARSAKRLLILSSIVFVAVLAIQALTGGALLDRHPTTRAGELLSGVGLLAYSLSILAGWTSAVLYAARDPRLEGTGRMVAALIMLVLGPAFVLYLAFYVMWQRGTDAAAV
jgi:hypothetical protein